MRLFEVAQTIFCPIDTTGLVVEDGGHHFDHAATVTREPRRPDPCHHATHRGRILGATPSCDHRATLIITPRERLPLPFVPGTLEDPRQLAMRDVARLRDMPALVRFLRAMSRAMHVWGQLMLYLQYFCPLWASFQKAQPNLVS